MLRYQEYRPARALRPYVRCYWTMLAPPGGSRVLRHRVLPDGCLDLVFTAGADGPAGASALVAVGAMTRYLEVDAAPVTIGVRFLPGRAGLLLGHVPAALTNGQVALADLWPDGGSRLLDAMHAASSVRGRITCLDAALRSRLAAVGSVDAVVAHAVARIAASHGQVREAALVAGAGLGARQLRRRFASAVGLTPKQFARIVRFRTVIDRVQAAPAVSWVEAALDAGYYDQAHLIHDFKALSGRTPVEYAAARAGTSAGGV